MAKARSGGGKVGAFIRGAGSVVNVGGARGRSVPVPRRSAVTGRFVARTTASRLAADTAKVSGDIRRAARAADAQAKRAVQDYNRVVQNHNRAVRAAAADAQRAVDEYNQAVQKHHEAIRAAANAERVRNADRVLGALARAAPEIEWPPTAQPLLHPLRKSDD